MLYMSETAEQPLNTPLPCLRCGYDLRGSVGTADARCPECAMRLASARPYQIDHDTNRFIDDATRNALGNGGAMLGGVIVATLAFVQMLAASRGLSPRAVGVGLLLAVALSGSVAVIVVRRRLTTTFGEKQRLRRSAFLVTLIGAVSYGAFALGLSSTIPCVLILAFHLLSPGVGSPPLPLPYYAIGLLIGIALARNSRWIGFRFARRIMHTAVVGTAEAPEPHVAHSPMHAPPNRLSYIASPNARKGDRGT